MLGKIGTGGGAILEVLGKTGEGGKAMIVTLSKTGAGAGAVLAEGFLSEASTRRERRPRVFRWWSIAAMVAAVMVSIARSIECRALVWVDGAQEVDVGDVGVRRRTM